MQEFYQVREKQDEPLGMYCICSMCRAMLRQSPVAPET